MAISIDDLAARNAAFAARGTYRGQSFPSGQTLRVVTCVDPRVDPALVLGLDLGEAVVMRNIGGRITPAAVRSWQLLATLGRPGAAPASRPQLVILHHTDCGIRTLAQDPESLAAYFEIPVADLDAKAVLDPYESVRIDVELTRRALPALEVAGLVYDVQTGLIDVVVPPTE